MHTSTISVLRRLDDREFRSGERLARELGVSRGSIWNALTHAHALGVRVQRVHGRGYRLAQPLDWLDAATIRARLAAHGLSADVLDTCGSTNTELLRAAEQGALSGKVLVTELQTAGRGRLGRQWHSSLASALTFSMLWRFEKSVAGLAGLSLAVGVAIARALRRRGAAAELKWPNDLLWRGAKLGGILIEVRGDALGPCATVIGIGLNMRLAADARARIDQPCADLAQALDPLPARTELLIELLTELAATLSAFERHGYAHTRAEWDRYHAHRDRTVNLTLPDGSVVLGTARGVDASGRLLLATAAGLRAFLAGDVSLRSARDTGD